MHHTHLYVSKDEHRRPWTWPTCADRRTLRPNMQFRGSQTAHIGGRSAGKRPLRRINLFDPLAVHDGVIGHCKQTGVAFVPYSPVGGPRGPGSHVDSTARDGLGLQPLCQRLGCSPHELMLSWLLQIDDCIIPIPGATRVESIASITRAAQDKFPLADEDIAQFLK